MGDSLNELRYKQLLERIVELENSEALYHDLVEMSQDLIWRCDAEGRYVYLNAAWSDVFGYSIDEMLGRRFSDFQRADQAAKDVAVFYQLLQGTSVKSLETVHIGKNGNDIYLVFNAKYVRDSSGAVVGVCGTAYDVTERKKAEEKLRQSEEALNKAEEMGRFGHWQLDLKNRRFTASEGAQRIYGFSSPELYGVEDIQKIPMAKYRPMMDKALSDLIRHNAVYAVEYKIQRALDGQVLDIQSKAEYDAEAQTVFGTIQDISTQKQLDEVLRTNEQFMRTITDSIPGMVGYWDKDLKCKFANSAYLDFFGRSKEQMLGISMQELLQAELFAKNEPYIRGALAGERQTFERILTKTDGTRSNTWVQYVPNIVDEVVEGIFAIVTDITEIKQIQLALEEVNCELEASNKAVEEMNQSLQLSERKYRNLVDNSLVGIFHNTVAGEVLYVNAALAKLLEFESVDEVLLMGAAACYNDAQQYNEVMEQLREKGHIDGYEVVLLTKYGNERTFMLSAVVDGQMVDGTIIDITERKKAEDALRENRLFLSDIIEHNGALIYAKDTDGRYELVNSKWEEITGQLRTAVIGKTDVEVFSGELGLEYRRADVQVMEQGKLLKFDERFESAKGERSFISIKFPLFDSNNVIRGICGMSTEITERIEYEKRITQQNSELAEVNATKDKFFSIIAHDLRGPLGSLCSFSQILHNDYFQYDDERRQYFISILYNQSKRTFGLLENLLEWSRLQRKQLVPNLVLHSINAMLLDVVMLLHESAVKKNITIRNGTANDLIAYCDLNMTGTVLRNLLSNAIKFTPENGIVDVLACKDGMFIEYRVTDTGKGMTAEKMANLFNIAKNKSTNGTAHERGTGLGLPLCKEMVERLGGTIWVESELDGGSRFIFRLPYLVNA